MCFDRWLCAIPHLSCQPDGIKNHLGDTLLGVSVRTFPEGFNEEGRPILSVDGAFQQAPGA